MTEETKTIEARYSLELRDAAGAITTINLKKKPDVGISKVVIYGGGCFVLEHSKLSGLGGREHWVAFYGEEVAFSADIEQPIRQLFDETDMVNALADSVESNSKAIDAALQLANVCVKCGAHHSACEWRPGNTDPYAKQCCESCTHPRWERCGHVAQGQRGIPDGYACRKLKGHELDVKDNGYHARGPAGWPVNRSALIAFTPPPAPPTGSFVCLHQTTHQIDGGDLVCNDCGANLYTEHLVAAHPNLEERLQVITAKGEALPTITGVDPAAPGADRSVEVKVTLDRGLGEEVVELRPLVDADLQEQGLGKTGVCYNCGRPPGEHGERQPPRFRLGACPSGQA